MWAGNELRPHIVVLGSRCGAFAIWRICAPGLENSWTLETRHGALADSTTMRRRRRAAEDFPQKWHSPGEVLGVTPAALSTTRVAVHFKKQRLEYGNGSGAFQMVMAAHRAWLVTERKADALGVRDDFLNWLVTQRPHVSVIELRG